MAFWKRVKEWLFPDNTEPAEGSDAGRGEPSDTGSQSEAKKLNSPNTQHPVPQEDTEHHYSETDTIPTTTTPQDPEEAEQIEKIKALLESNDLSNHELAAMFMLGLGKGWDASMYALVSNSADKLTFWAEQEDNADFLNLVVDLKIGPRFFGQYSEVAAFAEIVPRFTALRSLYWGAKHYWNQHPILAAASQLPQLERLHIESSKMNFLPDYIGQATQLRALYLSNNKLTELPESIEELTQLEILDLSGNQFTTCPRSISKLKRLEVLKLQDNPLEEVKARLLGRLYRLRDLQLPQSVAQAHLDTLKDWLPDVDFGQPYWQFDQEEH